MLFRTFLWPEYEHCWLSSLRFAFSLTSYHMCTLQYARLLMINFGGIFIA